VRLKDLQNLHDRTTLGPEYQARLTNPDPTLGWLGDPDLVLTYNRLEDCYEVWREEVVYDTAVEDYVTRYTIIAKRSTKGARFDIAQLIRGLVARDSYIEGNSAKQAMEKYLAEVSRETEEGEARMVEALMEPHAKVAHALARDTGNLSTFVSMSGAYKK
jgi:hypothetical protein